jgi:glycosyltransferase involved in cell wall biosynthesis
MYPDNQKHKLLIPDSHEAPETKEGISVVLPAFNEESTLGYLIETIIDFFDSTQYSYEIIIVNDGSTDKTGEIANRLSADHQNVSVIHHSENKGYGKSLKNGLYAGKYDYLFFTDADSQFKINSFEAFLPFIESGEADMVIGYRINRKDNLLRKLCARSFNSLVQMLFSLEYKDINCAFKLFKKGVFERLNIEADDSLFNAELLVKASRKHLRIVQLGVDHYPRANGESTVSYTFIPSIIKNLFSLHRTIKLTDELP